MKPTKTMKDIKLNYRLYRVVSRDDIDFPLVEELLKEGADPIGSCSEEYEYETVFGKALINILRIFSLMEMRFGCVLWTSQFELQEIDRKLEDAPFLEGHSQ